MIDRVYLHVRSAAAIVAVLACSLSSCKSMIGDSADPERVAKVETRIEEVQHVADVAAAAAAGAPGLGGIAGIAALVSGVAGVALSYYRNQTRKSDPAVANALAGQSAGGAS